MAGPLSLLLLSFCAFAEDAANVTPPALQLNLAPPKIEAHAPPFVEARESTVVIDGQKYRRIVYNNEIFYLRLQSSSPGQWMDPIHPNQENCWQQPNDINPNDQAGVASEGKLTKVTSVFVEGLYRDCSSYRPTARDFRGGLRFHTSQNSSVDVGVRPIQQGVVPKANLNVAF